MHLNRITPLVTIATRKVMLPDCVTPLARIVTDHIPSSSAMLSQEDPRKLALTCY